MDFDRYKDRILIIMLVIITSIFTMLLDSVGAVGKLYDITALATVPLRESLHERGIRINNFFGVIGKISLLQSENEELKNENSILLERVSDLEEVSFENENLKKQLHVAENIDDTITQARVIGNDIVSNNTIQINVGSRNSIRDGDVVFFGKYVIGKVQKVETYSSEVLLITSPTSNIPARGQKNRALGILTGKVGKTLTMSNILPGEHIEEGELVITSGVESKFPPGFIVGKVIQIDKNPANATQEAEVEIQIDLSRLDYVYIISTPS